MSEIQTLTIACKMKVSSDLAKEIDETLLTFAVACDWINNNTPVKLTNKAAMQSLVYQDVRTKFGLSSNLAIQAVRRVCANRKTAKQKGKNVKEFSPTSISYDARIFSFREEDYTVSLKLLHKRHRFELLIGNYQRGILKGVEPTSATLVKRKSGDYYIHIQIDKPVPDSIETDDVIGVDLGRTDIASTSVRERTNKKPRSKKDKRLGNNWAFYQLRQYLTYKCLLAGVKLILVNPAWTSQTCHKCFVIGNRNGKKFTCSKCGIFDADWNGSQNIAALGRLINSPRGTGLSCKVKREVECIQLTLFDALGLPKTPSFYTGG